MKIRTRLHDPITGAYVRDVTSLDFGSVVAGAPTATMVLSLVVEGVARIGGVSLVVEDSKSVDLETGAFRFDRSMKFKPNHSPVQEFSGDRRRFNVRSVDDTTTEFVYLTYDSAKSKFSGSGVIGFRWSFDYVDASSSSSSSSSNYCGSCYRVEENDSVSIALASDEECCVDIHIDSTEYASIFLNGTEVELENDSGSIVFFEQLLSLNVHTGIFIGSAWYTVTLVHDSDTRFVVWIGYVGSSSSSGSSYSSSSSSNIGHTLYELVSMTNSSSSSSSSG